MLSLGIDSGTGSTKAIVLEVESGKILAQAQHSHETISGLPHGHVEQAPQTWTDAMEATIAGCLDQIGERRRELRALGVSGQQHGLVVLDGEGAPIRPAKLWCDTSTAAQAEALNAAFGGATKLINRTGNSMTPGYTAPKILWLKENEPENFERTKTILLPHDYLNFWLAGEARMEYGDASGTGLLDIRARTWCQPLLDFIDPTLAEKLPPLGSSKEAAGKLSGRWRERWSLPSDITISAGGGDNMMGAIGTGNIGGGAVTLSLGTSGTIYACTPQPVIDPRGEIAAFCDSTDHWLPLACTMNVAVAIDQARALFGWDLATMEAAVAAAPAGSGGLLFLPYLQGERTPNLPHASGVFYGLTTENMNAPMMARAVLEGVMFGLAYAMRRFVELGVEPKEIRLTGGVSKSATFRQMAADALGYPTVTLQTAEGAALGAAIQAAATYQATSLAQLVEQIVQIDPASRCQPRAKESALYLEMAQRHSDLTDKLHRAGYL